AKGASQTIVYGMAGGELTTAQGTGGTVHPHAGLWDWVEPPCPQERQGRGGTPAPEPGVSPRGGGWHCPPRSRSRELPAGFWARQAARTCCLARVMRCLTAPRLLPATSATAAAPGPGTTLSSTQAAPSGASCARVARTTSPSTTRSSNGRASAA